MPKETPQDAPAPQDAEEFDLDAWIDDARLPERSVTVYGRADLVAEHDELEDQLTRHRAAYVDDDRLADPTTEIAARMRELSQQIQASEMTFRFRALQRNESKAVTESAPKDDSGEPDADYVAAAWLAASCVSPKGLTPEKAFAIRGKIGEGQFLKLWRAAYGVTNERDINIPFSLAASVALNSKDS